MIFTLLNQMEVNLNSKFDRIVSFNGAYANNRLQYDDEFELGPIRLVSQIDRFYASWASLSMKAMRLMQKLSLHEADASISPRHKSILHFIESHPGCKSGEISAQLNIPSRSVKRLLSELEEKNLLLKQGADPGTNYTLALRLMKSRLPRLGV